MEYDVEKISHKIKNKRVTKKIFKYIMLTILIILFICNLMLSYEEKNHILGIYVFNIISESMEPTLYVNDMVIVQKCAPENLKKGDIITYLQEERTISHTIIGITRGKNYIKFQTKGDNNPVPDDYEVDSAQVYGKVIHKIKGIGKAVKYIQNARGFINIIIVIIIIFILVSLKDSQKHNRKITRKKYEIKKKRENYHL